MSMMFNSKFHSHSIKIEDFKINPFNLLTLLAPRGGVKILKDFLEISYKMLRSEFHSHSIKIEDFKINPINPFNPISTKGGSENVEPITRNVL